MMRSTIARTAAAVMIAGFLVGCMDKKPDFSASISRAEGAANRAESAAMKAEASAKAAGEAAAKAEAAAAKAEAMFPHKLHK